jgi:hypothetical protein
MQLFNKTNLANTEASWTIPILYKFSCFSGTESIEAIDYFVTPIGRDRSYVVLRVGDTLYVLVTADYPDPLHDAGEFVELSKKYTFTRVITPVKKRLVNVKDVETDNVGDDFYIELGTTYYYCAEVESV